MVFQRQFPTRPAGPLTAPARDSGQRAALKASAFAALAKSVQDAGKAVANGLQRKREADVMFQLRQDEFNNAVKIAQIKQGGVLQPDGSVRMPTPQDDLAVYAKIQEELKRGADKAGAREENKALQKAADQGSPVVPVSSGLPNQGGFIGAIPTKTSSQRNIPHIGVPEIDNITDQVFDMFGLAEGGERSGIDPMKEAFLLAERTELPADVISQRFKARMKEGVQDKDMLKKVADFVFDVAKIRFKSDLDEARQKEILSAKFGFFVDMELFKLLQIEPERAQQRVNEAVAKDKGLRELTQKMGMKPHQMTAAILATMKYIDTFGLFGNDEKTQTRNKQMFSFVLSQIKKGGDPTNVIGRGFIEDPGAGEKGVDPSVQEAADDF